MDFQKSDFHDMADPRTIDHLSNAEWLSAVLFNRTWLQARLSQPVRHQHQSVELFGNMAPGGQLSLVIVLCQRCQRRMGANVMSGRVK